MPRHSCQHNQKRRADADSLIDHLFGQAKCREAKKGKGKANNANLFIWLACQSISAKQARPREIMTPMVPSFQPPTHQNWEKRKQKSRGDASLFTPMQPTKKSRC